MRFTQMTWPDKGRPVPNIPPFPLTLLHLWGPKWRRDSSRTSDRGDLLFSRSVMFDSLQPTDCSTPGFPLLHYLMEFFQIHKGTKGGQVSELALSPAGRSEIGSLCLQQWHECFFVHHSLCDLNIFSFRFLSESKFTSCKRSKVWSVHLLFKVHSIKAIPEVFYKKKKNTKNFFDLWDRPSFLYSLDNERAHSISTLGKNGFGGLWITGPQFNI